MSNVASEHLYQLIQSLTKAEKRYFKLYSMRHVIGDSNNYRILFDAIDKQKAYSEMSLKKKFAGTPMIKRFSISKSRLYDTVLQSLTAFHANSSIDAQLKRMIHSAEILYKKSLYKQSRKLLHSAKKLAYKYNKHTSLLEIFMWEKMLIEKDHYTKIGEEELQHVMQEDQLIINKILVYSDFWNIKSRLFYILSKRGKARNAKELLEFKRIIDKTLLERDEEYLYFETKYLYYHIYSAYYFGIGDYPRCAENLAENINHIEKHSKEFSEESNTYFSVLSNAIYVEMQLHNHKRAFELLDKLKNLPENLVIESNEDLDIKLFSSINSIELTLYTQLGQLDKGLALVPIIEEGMRLYGSKINNLRKAYFFFQIAIVYFIIENYSEALRRVNKLLNDINIDDSQDIYCFGQILNLIIHIELDNRRLIPYALRTTLRYLQTRHKVYKFENVILQFIGKFASAKKPEQIQKLYHQLYSSLISLQKDKYENSAFEYFDFIAWSKSKISEKSFCEIIKEKALANH